MSGNHYYKVLVKQGLKREWSIIAAESIAEAERLTGGIVVALGGQ